MKDKLDIVWSIVYPLSKGKTTLSPAGDVAFRMTKLFGVRVWDSAQKKWRKPTHPESEWCLYEVMREARELDKEINDEWSLCSIGHGIREALYQLNTYGEYPSDKYESRYGPNYQSLWERQ